jgi:phosphatidylserine/phosphatidylglycerophosphate/cardiolipin synthase-like enzyme
MAKRVHVIVDAADYFEAMQRAMLCARERIMLIGWDFDTRIHLTHGRRWWQKAWRRDFPARLGSFIPWLVNEYPELEVRILKWGAGALKFFVRGSMLFDIIRWLPHRRIDFKFDTAHPVGCSHHQKIVLIDDHLAVCGGIDMTSCRWDTREHPENDPRRKRPGGSSYGPWHDATMMMEGPIASALDELARDRWRQAGGKPLEPPQPSTTSAWPDGLEPHFENVEIGIARTRVKYGGETAVREVESLFLQQIWRARRFIYAENQYFASRAIAEAITNRLVEDDPPEIVIVQPATAENWVESAAMDPTRARLVRAIEEIDHRGRFHLFTPYTGATPIYVHAKLLIVDDEVLRIGSANFNNRSMGLDSECDVFIDSSRPGNERCVEAIRSLRLSLLAEHCGLSVESVAAGLERTGSMAAMIYALGEGRKRYLRPFHPPKLTDLEKSLADRQTLDPEEPAEMFTITPPGRGLFRPGSLLSRARHARLHRRHAHGPVRS